MKSIHTREQICLQRLLRVVRTDAGLTQDKLAKKLREPQSYVSKYESGERLLDVLEVRHVCKAVGISLTDFVKRLEKEFDDAP